MGLWFEENYADKVRFGLRATRSIYHGRSEYQSIDVFDTVKFGRVLALDSVFQTSVADEYYYHEMLVHPALLAVKAPKRVLIIGGGDGGSVREVLRHPEVEHVTMCELDEQVVRVCQEHLTEFGVPWDSDRLELRFGDGVAYLNEPGGEPFDVILVDGPDPVGPAEGLYQSPFYETCKGRLAEGGVLAVQSESPFMMDEDFVRIVRTLRGVFPVATPYFARVPIYVSGIWSWTFASETVQPLEFDHARAEALEKHTRFYNRDIHYSVFAQPNDIKAVLGD